MTRSILQRNVQPDVILLVGILLLARHLFDHNARAQTFRVSAKAGVSHTNVISEFPAPSIDVDLGWHTGYSILAIGEWTTIQTLAVLAETGYVRRG